MGSFMMNTEKRKRTATRGGVEYYIARHMHTSERITSGGTFLDKKGGRGE